MNSKEEMPPSNDSLESMSFSSLEIYPCSALKSFTPVYFGYWHGVSLSCGVAFSTSLGAALQYFSKRYINRMWLLKDGKNVQIEFFNAFWVPEQPRKFKIADLGYFQESKLYNTKYATYQQKKKLYISLQMNRYSSKVHQGLDVQAMIDAIFQGRNVITDQLEIKAKKRSG